MFPWISTQAFSDFAKLVADAVGSWQAFVAALTIVVLWALSGFYFGFANELYQLFINTSTTIVTFLVVFVLQHTQNRDTITVQLKLDELIRANRQAHNYMIRLDHLTEHELLAMKRQFDAMAKENGGKPGKPHAGSAVAGRT